MATTYVVLLGDDDHAMTWRVVESAVNANHALGACRAVAEKMTDAELDNGGVTLIAIPARNWTSGRHTLRAETQRRIRAT